MAWMASCILMHMVEAAGLHCEPSSGSVLPAAEDIDSELRRRLVAVAQHLNIWMSFDMGRSRVALCNATVIMPSARPGDQTVELMELLPYSAALDPEKEPNISELESALSAVLNRVHTSPPSTMAQCNLALCLCRRLQSMNTSMTGTVLDQMLSLTSEGIQAAQAILDARAPWHHMANVPLQIVCVLLAIDASSTMSQLRDVMQCLSNVAAVYATDATQEALKTASLLIRLHQRWKEKCASDLGDILKPYPMVRLHDVKNDPSVEQLENVMWLDALTGDLSHLEYADLDQLLVPGLFCDTTSN
ncbi:multidrug resistance protein [Neonectria punicea]|uniref:Multidrug resistance protein n=1 Tax=Neonectria punicea TaxID=979145 RepID=A0ABR1GK39_9HYPO